MVGPGIRTQDLSDESLAPYRSELSRQPLYVQNVCTKVQFNSILRMQNEIMNLYIFIYTYFLHIYKMVLENPIRLMFRKSANKINSFMYSNYPSTLLSR